MRILWHNIFAMILLIGTIVLIMVSRRELAIFLMGARYIGPAHDIDRQILGLIAFGLVGIFTVAIVKILTQGNGGPS